MAFEAVTAKRGLIPTLPAAVAFVCAVKSQRASVVGGTGEIVADALGVAVMDVVTVGVAVTVGIIGMPEIVTFRT
jgi:hypothetical protein